MFDNQFKNSSGTISYNDLLKSSESDVTEIEKLQPTISPDSGANIQFTSGTTGHPKAAMVSHFSIVNNAYDSGKANLFFLIQMSLTQKFILGVAVGLDKAFRRIALNLPFFHVAGIISIMNTVIYGSTLVVPSPHFHGEYSLRAIVGEKCDGIYSTPSSNLFNLKLLR